MNIIYIVGGKELLDEIGPLWNKLNQHHYEKSPYFKEKFQSFNFSQRKLGLLNRAETGNMRIDLVKDKSLEKPVGYCVSSINKEGVGEIESLYVDEAYRGCRIGQQLMGNALEWFEDRACETIQIGVAVGNEEAYDFYKKFNFYPSVTLLKKAHKQP